MGWPPFMRRMPKPVVCSPTFSHSFSYAPLTSRGCGSTTRPQSGVALHDVATKAVWRDILCSVCLATLSHTSKLPYQTTHEHWFWQYDSTTIWHRSPRPGGGGCVIRYLIQMPHSPILPPRFHRNLLLPCWLWRVRLLLTLQVAPPPTTCFLPPRRHLLLPCRLWRA